MSLARRPSRVIAAPGHTVVRASAGTGKTYRLAVRYLALLAAGAQPSSILATTFTRKAAGEILQRVMGRLATAALDETGHTASRLAEEVSRELGLASSAALALGPSDAMRMLDALCMQLHRASIGTIDSFLYRTAMSFRHELGLPRGVDPTDERHREIKQLREDAIAAMLEGPALKLLVDLLRRVNHDQAKRSVRDALKTIVTDLSSIYAEAPDAAVWRTLVVPPSPLRDESAVAAAVARMEEIAEGMPNKTWATAHRTSREAAEQRDWEGFLAKGIAANLADGQTKFSRRDIPPDVAEVYQPLVEHAKTQPLRAVARQTAAMHELMERFEAQFRPLQAERGLMLFDDFSRRLATAHQIGVLGLEEMYYRLDGRIQHLLLDEFQDTSLAQWAVLEPLAAEIAAYADGSRSLFCVGDVKQSIYAWRGGCPDLFDELPQRLHLDVGPGERLNVSYRSSPTIIAAVNRVFEHLSDVVRLASKHADVVEAWRARFEPHDTNRTDLPGYVMLASSPWDDDAAEDDAVNDEADDTNGDTSDEGNEASASDPHLRWCADQIAKLAADFPGRSIGVLTRSNTPAGPLLDLLRRQGCEASGEGGQALTDDPAVNIVLSALRFANHPGHTAAAHHVLHSPLAAWLGLACLEPQHLEQVAADIRHALVDEGYGGVIGQWAVRLAPHGDARSAVRLTQLVELADAESGASPLRPGAFVQIVEGARVEEPTPAAVRVMTIHAAKGLEFDLVVLPELDTPLPGHRETCWVMRAKPTGPVRAVYARANTAARAQSPQLEAAHRQHVNTVLRDELCALYVAMTRARQGLFMFIKSLKAKQDGSPRERGLKLSSVLVDTLSTIDEQAQTALVFYEAGDRDRLGTDATMNAIPTGEALRPSTLHVLAPTADETAGQRAWRSWRRTSPSSLEAGARVRAAELLELDVSEARQRGRVIHAFFEHVGDLGDPVGPWGGVPTPEQLASLSRRIAPGCAASWHDAQIDAFAAMLQRSAVREALTLPTSAGASLDLWREREFVVRLGAQLVTGFFDRAVVGYDASGSAAWARLIDFKTDHLGEQAQYLEASVRRYRPQVDAYRQALASLLRLDPVQIEAALLFVVPGVAVDVTGHSTAAP